MKEVNYFGPPHSLPYPYANYPFKFRGRFIEVYELVVWAVLSGNRVEGAFLIIKLKEKQSEANESRLS